MPRTALSAADGIHVEIQNQRTLAQLADVVVVAELDRQLDDAPDADGDEAGSSNAGHDLLQVGHVVCAGDKRGGAAKEGVLSRGVYQGLLLSLLDCGAGEGDIAAEFLGRQ